MKKKEDAPFYSVAAALWDGSMQLSGKLEIWETEVNFKLKDFEKSNLNLKIPLETIETIEEFLVYDLAENGLKIQNNNGKYDLFILDNLKDFKKRLTAAMSSIKCLK